MEPATQINNISIQCADKSLLRAVLHDTQQPKGTVIISSALGVPHTYYHHFALFLSQHHYRCITFDYRGTGDNLQQHSSSQTICMWGIKDIEAVLNYAFQLTNEQGKTSPTHFIGHSIGGQILGLAKSAPKLKSAILVAASAPYWKRWKFPEKIGFWIAFRFIFPLACLFTKQFPNKVFGLGTLTTPTSAMKQWLLWMNQSDYLFDPKFKLNTQHYSELTYPILSLGFSDDMLAPTANIKKLLSFYTHSIVTAKFINHQQYNPPRIGHIGLFKPKFSASLWSDILNWLNLKTINE